MLAFSYGDLADLALAVFLVAVGLGIGWAFLRLAVTFDRLSSLIRGAEREVLPVINKVGGSVDRVNAQLDKLDTATDSAVDAVEAADEAVRAVSFAVKRPVQKLAGFTSGASHGWSSLRTNRSWSQAVDDAKDAAAQRERDLDEELKARTVPTVRRTRRVADEITLTLPREPEFHRVAHLVLGGLAVRLNLTIENLEDMQIALDALLEREDGGKPHAITVRMSPTDRRSRPWSGRSGASSSTRSTATPATSSGCGACSSRPSTRSRSTETRSA